MSVTETEEKTETTEVAQDVAKAVADDPFDYSDPSDEELDSVDKKDDFAEEDKLNTGLTDDEVNEAESKKTESKAEEKTESKTDTEGDNTVDDALVAIATDYGMTEKEARSFDSARDLEKHLLIISEREEKSTEKTDGKEKKEAEPEKFKIELGEGEFDEDMVKSVNEALAKVVDRYEGNAEKLQQEVDVLKGTLQKNQAALFITNFDKHIDSHSKAYEKELGSGPTSELEEGSPELKNRVAVIEEMDTLVAGYTLRNRTIPSDEELVRRAQNNLFGDRAAKTARKELSDKLSKRSRSSVARPNSPTKKKAPTGDKQQTTKDAVEAVGALMKEKGLTIDTVDESFE